MFKWFQRNKHKQPPGKRKEYPGEYAVRMLMERAGDTMNIFKNLFKKQELPFIPPTPPTPSQIKREEAESEKLPAKFHLRVLAISDTHGHLSTDENLSLLKKQVDVCFLLGDISPDELQYIKETVKAPIYGVLGNHDSLDSYSKRDIEDINGKVVEIKGVKIAGIGGSIRYKKGNFPMLTDDESIELVNTLPKADVLISHDSPKYLHGNLNFVHSGLQGITDYIAKYNVLNIHGHYHENKIYSLPNGNKSICVYGVQILEI